MADSNTAKHRSPRRRLAPVAVLAAVAASGAIALSLNGTLAGFVAQITNNSNTASSGYLTMQETSGSTTCNSNGTGTSGATATNAITCNINKFNGSTTIVPGSSVSATVTIANTGTVTANTFTLTPGTCSQVLGTVNGGATDACSKFTLAINSGATVIKAATPLSTLAGTAITLPTMNAGSSAPFTFTLSLPSSGSNATDNTYQGITVNQNLVWNFTS